MMRSTQEQYNELACYTLSHPDRQYFIHQHVLDAFQAETATETTKPICLIFSLVDLDDMIRAWCISVWRAYKTSPTIISMLAKTELGLG